MRTGADTLLWRALELSADRAGAMVCVERSAMTRWASATFAGARHEMIVSGSDCAGFCSWLVDLPESELPLRGHLLADLKIVTLVRDGTAARAAIEALTVEEG